MNRLAFLKQLFFLALAAIGLGRFLPRKHSGWTHMAWTFYEDGSDAKFYVNGQLRHVAMWSEALTVGEVETLALGASPLQVRPDALESYYPLVGP